MELNKTDTKLPSNKENHSAPNAIAPIKASQLMKLFEGELKDLYWAENALSKAIPTMITNATSQELKDVLTSHLAETGKQVVRLEQVFESIDKKATAKKCLAMEGLIKEAEEKMESGEGGAKCDSGIISSAQKVEHYEISSYATLCQFAETLGLSKAETLLEATLNEERATETKLSEIAQLINVEAAE
jgi:ferritin-like metal-binding protein YciE